MSGKNIQKVLESQVAEARRTISSDGYPMSVGELTSMYKAGELLIRPEFQRFFRWSNKQKSSLVESIMLGIPLPSIFVAQTPDGTWELVDGLQRVSTILELQGELRDKGAELLPQLELMSTKYLPALEGKFWEAEDERFSLTAAQRLDIKRSKLDIKIIKRESSPETKFDLFQRLNSYGSVLNAQELRSAMLVAVSSDFFAWLERLASYPAFMQTVQVSERLLEERYDIELVLRFLVLHNRESHKLVQNQLRDFARVLDEESINLASGFDGQYDALAKVFMDTFDFILANGAEDVFRKWDAAKEDFRGSFLNTSFEVFALGVGYNLASGNPLRGDLIEAVKEFWTRPGMQRGFATGRSTEARMAEFVPLGRKLVGTAV